MDTAVGLVQAYLRLNGFFTVTEYPIVEFRSADSRTLTDVDVLATRFPGAGRWVPDLPGGSRTLPPDPVLDVSAEVVEVLICEVKEGAATLNRSAYSQKVVEAVIRRLGCCGRDHEEVARRIATSGASISHFGAGAKCRIRMVAFGASGSSRKEFTFVPLKHVFQFIESHFDDYSEVFLHTQMKDPSLGLLALMKKVGLQAG